MFQAFSKHLPGLIDTVRKGFYRFHRLFLHDLSARSPFPEALGRGGHGSGEEVMVTEEADRNGSRDCLCFKGERSLVFFRKFDAF